MNQKRMLLVDDLEENRTLLRSCFEASFSVSEAKNGLEALMLLCDQPFDLLITDIYMPVMDGLTLVKTLRSDPDFFSLSIVVITDRGEENELMALEAGADDFVNKPFHPELLHHRINNLFSSHPFTRRRSASSSSHIQSRIPFATIRLLRQEDGAPYDYEYQYANNAFHKLFHYPADQSLTPDLRPELPGIISLFIQACSDPKPIAQTFWYAPEDRYFNVNAYGQEHDFCSFVMLENLSVRNEREHIQQAMAGLMTVNPQTLCTLYLDLSANLCYRKVCTSNQLDYLSEQTTLTAAVTAIAEHAATDSSREAILRQLNPTTLLQDYERGHRQQHFDVLLRLTHNSATWIRLYLRMKKDEQFHGISATLSLIDIQESKLSQLVINTVLQQNYDTLFWVDLDLDTALVYSGDGDVYWSNPISCTQMDAAVADYLQSHYVGAHKDRFIAENRISLIAERMKDVPSYSVEYQLLEQDGNVHTKRGSYYWLDETRRHLCFVRSDITEERSAEHRRSSLLELALQSDGTTESHYSGENQRILDHLLRNLPGGIIIYRCEHQHLTPLYFNSGLARLSGRTTEKCEQWLKNGILQSSTVYEEDLAGLTKAVNHALLLGAPIHYTYRQVCQDGSLSWVQLSAEKVRDEGSASIYYAVYTALPEQEIRYRTMCENAPFGIFVCDRNSTRLLFVSQSAKTILHVSGDYEGQTCQSYFHFSPDIVENSHLLNTPNDGFFTTLVHDAESLRYFQFVRGRVTWDGADACIIYLTDETEHMDYQKKSQALLKAEASNAAKTDFLSRMSHDIRTPMNVIIGMTDMALELPELSDRAAEYLNNIKTSSHFLLSLINDVLDMSKIENDSVTLSMQPYNLSDFCHQVEIMFHPKCRQKGVSFSLSIDPEMPQRIITDPTRFNQIIFNLLSNAVKFTPPGGTVELFCTILELTKTQVKKRIVVHDTGIGMSRAFQEHMFEPFSQEESSCVQESTGTGLGLSIVKKLVGLMGGVISVESAPGEGSTFTIDITFDLCPDDSVPSSEVMPDSSVLLRGKHILVCEDHSLNARIAQNLLEKVGITCDLAQNGVEGLNLFTQAPSHTYDAILMDIRMPVMDGLAATRAIRALVRSDAKTIPILAMTANAFDEDRELSLAAGMNSHLSKPIDPAELYRQLREQLSYS